MSTSVKKGCFGCISFIALLLIIAWLVHDFKYHHDLPAPSNQQTQASNQQT